eukprot:TRINITY_DN10907_c0_g1_i36.p2 TRINITY_DN10907_c0_g1~~TRINITY_DN10907_c0_g1_i36.p2  ORF type:complete len:145 (-),score=48.99 TRINITY_DN10907_c0_g1_i36:117-551(-)
MAEENKAKKIPEAIAAERQQTAKLEEELTNQESCLKEIENKLRKLCENSSGEDTTKAEDLAQTGKEIEELKDLYENQLALSAEMRRSIDLMIEANRITNERISRYKIGTEKEMDKLKSNKVSGLAIAILFAALSTALYFLIYKR